MSSYSCHKVKRTHGQRGLTHITMKVHHTKSTLTHTHTGIYIYIYIHHHNATTQSRRVNQTLLTFQGYDPARYKECKTDIVIPKESASSKEQER